MPFSFFDVFRQIDEAVIWVSSGYSSADSGEHGWPESSRTSVLLLRTSLYCSGCTRRAFPLSCPLDSLHPLLAQTGQTVGSESKEEEASPSWCENMQKFQQHEIFHLASGWPTHTLLPTPKVKEFPLPPSLSPSLSSCAKAKIWKRGNMNKVNHLNDFTIRKPLWSMTILMLDSVTNDNDNCANSTSWSNLHSLFFGNSKTIL